MANTLKLVLTDYWFEEIKSGRKTHEYRKWTQYFVDRISKRQKTAVINIVNLWSFKKLIVRIPSECCSKLKTILHLLQLCFQIFNLYLSENMINIFAIAEFFVYFSGISLINKSKLVFQIYKLIISRRFGKH